MFKLKVSVWNAYKTAICALALTHSFYRVNFKQNSYKIAILEKINLYFILSLKREEIVEVNIRNFYFLTVQILN